MQNLWAEDSNHEKAEKTGASMGRAEKQGTSRPTEQVMPSRLPDAKRRTKSAGNRNTDPVLSSLRAWLLSDYVAPYCRSLAATRIFRRCFLIDALGGTRKTDKNAANHSFSTDDKGPAAHAPNIFDDLTQPVGTRFIASTTFPEKSRKQAPSLPIPPILQPVVSLAQELASENKPITLQGMILEGGKGKAITAENSFSLPKESALLSARWREIAPAMLPAIEQSAAIFLLNPIPASPSPGEIPFFTHDDLAPFYQRTAPTELCLLIAHKQIENSLLPSLRTPSGAAAFTSLLRSDRWKTLLGKDDGRTQATDLAGIADIAGLAGIAGVVDIVIDLFQAAMQPHFLAVQRIAFPMLLGPASIEDAPYTLLFATRRQDSLVCMNDAVCSYRRRLEEQSHRGILNEAWFREQQSARFRAALQHLSEDTLRLGRRANPRRWPDLRQQLLVTHFGQWLLRDCDEIILNLLQAGEVRCDWKQPAVATNSNIVGAPLAGALVDESKQPAVAADRNIVGAPLAGALSRVPGNEDTLLWKEKKRRY